MRADGLNKVVSVTSNSEVTERAMRQALRKSARPGRKKTRPETQARGPIPGLRKGAGKTVIALRVSTKVQARQGYSIPAQRAMCLDYSEEMQWPVAGEFCFPMSGRTIVHTDEFKRMVDAIESDAAIKFVTVLEIDRLVRDSDDFSDFRRHTERLGVQIVSVEEQYDGATDDGRDQMTRGAADAEKESRRTGARIRRGQMQKLKEGGWPHKPRLGYVTERRDTERRENEALLVPDQMQRELVLKAYELYSTRVWSSKALYKEMLLQGLRTPSGTKPTYSKFLAMLHDKLYIGILVWNGVEYKGYHEPIVPKALFYKVQKVFKERDLAGARLHKHNHYLRGTVFCGECGSRLCSLLAKGRFPYFFCMGRQRNPKDCRERYTPLEKLEQDVERFYATLPGRLPEEVRKELIREIKAEVGKRTEGSAKDLAAAQRLLRQLELADERAYEAFLSVGGLDRLKRTQERLRVQRADVEARMKAAASLTSKGEQLLELALSQIDEWNRAYLNSPDAMRQTINVELIRAAFVKDRQLVAVNVREPYQSLFTLGSSKNPMVDLAEQLSNPVICSRISQLHRRVHDKKVKKDSGDEST